MTPFRIYSGRSYTQPAQQLAALGIDPERFAPYLREIKRIGFGVPNVSGGIVLIPHGTYGIHDVCAFRAEGSTWHTFYSALDFGTFLTVEKPDRPANYLIIPDGCTRQAEKFIATVPPGLMIHYPNDEATYQVILAVTAGRGWEGGDRAHEYEGFKSLSAKRQSGLNRAISMPVSTLKPSFNLN